MIERNCIINKLEYPKHDGNAYYILRDDYSFSFGGNKYRKAEHYFNDITNGDFDYVVTYGSAKSNHSRVIANMCARYDLRCLIVSPSENGESPIFNHVICEILGAEIISCNINQVSETIDKTINKLKLNGYKPYFIPGGGHGPLGVKAITEMYQDIKNYELSNDLVFDYIFHASGTGSTQAGLICGKLINGDQKDIIGISIARKNPYGRNVVQDSVLEFLELCNKTDLYSKEDNIFIDHYIVDGYGSYNEAVLNVIEDVFSRTGIPLDKTYTGKAFWGMTDYIHKNQIESKNILFIHTGGTPLFFDWIRDISSMGDSKL